MKKGIFSFSPSYTSLSNPWVHNMPSIFLTSQHLQSAVAALTSYCQDSCLVNEDSINVIEDASEIWQCEGLPRPLSRLIKSKDSNSIFLALTPELHKYPQIKAWTSGVCGWKPGIAPTWDLRTDSWHHLALALDFMGSGDSDFWLWTLLWTPQCMSLLWTQEMEVSQALTRSWSLCTEDM